MLSLILLKKISSMLLIMAIGFAAVRLKVLHPEDSAILSKLNLFVISPCMIFNTFQVERSQDVLVNLGITMIVATIVHLSFIGITMLIRKPLKLNAVEQASVIYPNAANLVIPLVVAMFGNDLVVYTLPFICVTTVLHWTHMYTLMRPGYSQSLKGLMSNINLICIAISFVLFVLNIRFPYVVKDALQSATDMIGPISMLITGMLLGGQNLKEIFGNKRAYMVSLLRLIAVPVVSLIFYKLFSFNFLTEEGKKAMMICFLSGSSCAANNVVNMAELYGGDSKYASAINLITLVLSVVTMPVLILIYQKVI